MFQTGPASITVSFLNLVIHLHVWEDGKSTVLAIELHVQWDPGIIQWPLLDNLRLDATSKVKCLLVLAMGWYVAYIFLDNYTVSFTQFSSTDINFGNNSASCENGVSVGIEQQAEPETVNHLIVTAQLQHIAQVGMSRIQKFEQLEALQRACSRYSILASSFPIWNFSACALLSSTSSSAVCFARGVVHSVHIFPGKEFYLESTSLHIFQVANVFDYRCLMAVLVTYKSAQTFQVDFSLVDEAIDASSFELEVKASIQMYWPWYPGIWSIISEEVAKLVAEEGTETCCRASRLGSSRHDTAVDLAFVRVIWKYHIGQCDSFFQEQMVHRNRQTDSGCCCHLQSKLCGFTIYQLSNISTPDGMPWDPGGVIGSRIQAIAWGQAMFCRGGSVTPDIHLDWASIADGSKRAWPSWSMLVARQIRCTGGHGRGHERNDLKSETLLSVPFVSLVLNLSGGRSPQAAVSTVAALHKRRYPLPHAPATSGSKGVLQKCPHQCLRHGVAAAVLHFFDFFSDTKQKDALMIVAKLVKVCQEVDVPKAMEAAPALCNLLQSSDKTILESALSCLSMLASDARGKSEHMDRLCESKVVETAMRLLEKEGWKTIGDDTLPNILGLLKNLASASAKAVKSLFDLGVCDLLKQMITHYTSSHGNNDKLQKLLELIYQLMRPLEMSDTLRKNAVIEQNAYMDQLASIVTLIIQVGKSGALSSVCYGWIVVIGNIVQLSTPTFLMELQKTANLSSFLACLLARKNRHVVFQTLKVSKSLLQKQHQFFLDSFTKEGVKHAIDAMQEKEKHRNSSHKLKRKNNMQEHCVCFEFQSEASFGDGCKIENNAILNIAEAIKKSFFAVKETNKSPHRFGRFSTIVKGLFGSSHGHTMTTPTQNLDQCRELSEVSSRLLSDKLPSTSTFVLAESGSAKELSDYLSNGAYLNQNLNNCKDLLEQVKEVECRLQKFAHLALTMSNQNSAKPLEILVEKLLDALHMSYDSFPVILSHHKHCTRESTMIPLRRTENSKSLQIKFVKARREKYLQGYGGVIPVPISSKPEEIEEDLWPKICYPRNGQGSSRLMFCYKGIDLKSSATIFESLVRLMNDGQSDITIDQSFWNEKYTISYKRNKSKKTSNTRLSAVHEKLDQSLLKDPFFVAIFLGKLPGDVDESDPSYDLLFTLKVLEGLNRFSYQLSMDEKIRLFAESCQRNLDDLKVTISPIPQRQFISSLLTNKLELQMQDRLFKDGLIPSWCAYLVETCPFLFSFDARWKYFCLTVQCSFMADEASAPDEPSSSDEESDASDEESDPPDEESDAPDEESDAPNEAAKGTKRHEVARGNLLENAASMMAKHAASTTTIEVVFEGEVGTGRGPTFEFYSTVSHELQRFGIGMWRGDNARKAEGETGFIHSSFGLFPQPWSPAVTSSRGIKFSDVVQKFRLLGYIVARAILDGRILDIVLSKAFYKIMLGQELDIYHIPSFDPELGKTILEFQALVKRKKFLETSSENTSSPSADLSYKNMRLEDLCLDFTLPGNPEYVLVPGGSEKMVTLDNLEEYVHLIVDATLKSGIAKQIEAFKSSVNEVFALKTLRMFSEEEMERILCGEQDSWDSSKLEDHIKFEHGYDANSLPIVSFLDILREFGREEQRAFIQFTTGAPQLPLGGLASLDPELTIVRKQCDCNVDCELPSVNTCRHFIKLPPYSSKEIMKERLKYAITEGLGSFHLS